MLAKALQEHRDARSSKQKQCIVKEWAGTLEEADIVHFNDAMGDFTLSNRELHQIFRNAGASYCLEALRKHRTQVCPCQI